MIVTAIERGDLIAEIGGAPKVIASDAQHERCLRPPGIGTPGAPGAVERGGTIVG